MSQRFYILTDKAKTAEIVNLREKISTLKEEVSLTESELLKYIRAARDDVFLVLRESL